MASVALEKEKNSKESQIFLSFLTRQVVSDYSLLYRIEKLRGLIEECAAEQHGELEKQAILRLSSTIHNSKYRLKGGTTSIM